MACVGVQVQGQESYSQRNLWKFLDLHNIVVAELFLYSSWLSYHWSKETYLLLLRMDM